MAAGVGGLLANLMGGDPTQQIAAAMAGPNPAPNPNPGAPGAQNPSGAQQQGGGAPPQQPALPPAQAYAPDPANASTIALLLKVHQQDQLAADMNMNINRIGAGFGTAQQQHDKMAAIGAGGGGQDTLGALGEIQKLQSNQMDLQNKQRFQASADLLGQTVLGLKPGQGGLLASNPELFGLVAQHKLKDQDLTDTQKNMRDWEESAAKSGMSPQEIQSTKTLLLGGMVGGGTVDVKNMNHEIMLWKQQNPGKTDEQMLQERPELGSLSGFMAAKAETTKNAVASSKVRLDNKEALPEIEKGIAPIQANLDKLLDPSNLEHTITAIHSGGWGTSGWTGAASNQLSALTGGRIGMDPKTIEMQNQIRQLQGQLSGDVMKTQKNIRTQREFNSVTSGASPIFDPSATPKQIEDGLRELRDKFNLMQANARAAAGQDVPAEYADKVDKDYFAKDGPLWQGATVKNDFSGMSGADVDKAVAALAPGESFIGPDGKPHRKH